MPSRLKAILQYILVLIVTALLIWFSLRNLDVAEGGDKWSYLVKTWEAADKGWLIAMAVIMMLSHVVRAERWRMLMQPSGNETTTGFSMLSLMVGYLVNLVIPRGGEISRCYNLYKLDKTPVDISFGTVVTERIVDVICLLSLIGLSFLIESEKLLLFIDSLPIGSRDSKYNAVFYAAVVFIVMMLVVIWLYKKNERFKDFLTRTWIGFRIGLLSVFKLRRKWLFVFYSVLIWVLYYFTSYAVINAFPETRHLGFDAMLSLFAIGAIAMAAPLPGGTGSYHILVPQGLVFLYGISSANAVAFVFVFHGWQTLMMIVGGAVSLVITSVIVKKAESRNRL